MPPPCPETPERPARATSGTGVARYLSSEEKFADVLSQDPLRYSRLRSLSRSTHSEKARTFLGLADNFREQRVIELERAQNGETQRPALQDPLRRPKPAPRPASEPPAHTMRAVQRALAEEEDEAPLLRLPQEGGDDSD